jgi:hypothetical protein
MLEPLGPGAGANTAEIGGTVDAATPSRASFAEPESRRRREAVERPFPCEPPSLDEVGSSLGDRGSCLTGPETGLPADGDGWEQGRGSVFC